MARKSIISEGLHLGKSMKYNYGGVSSKPCFITWVSSGYSTYPLVIGETAFTVGDSKKNKGPTKKHSIIS